MGQQAIATFSDAIALSKRLPSPPAPRTPPSQLQPAHETANDSLLRQKVRLATQRRAFVSSSIEGHGQSFKNKMGSGDPRLPFDAMIRVQTDDVGELAQMYCSGEKDIPWRTTMVRIEVAAGQQELTTEDFAVCCAIVVYNCGVTYQYIAALPNTCPNQSTKLQAGALHLFHLAFSVIHNHSPRLFDETVDWFSLSARTLWLALLTLQQVVQQSQQNRIHHESFLYHVALLDQVQRRVLQTFCILNRYCPPGLVAMAA